MFLNDKFHEFYREVIALKRQLESGGNPAEARDALLRTLERQQHEAQRDEGQHGAEVYARAKYAMAAFADELFLQSESPALREAWMGHLLESKIARSQRAGEKFFSDIEDLASDRSAAAADLARIYLLVLGLGFEGKYRESTDAAASEALAKARRRLYYIIYKHEPHPLREEDRLVPDAYAETAVDAIGSELPYRRPWIWALVLVVLLWLGASHVLWRNAISDLEPLIEDVFESSAALHPTAGGSN